MRNIILSAFVLLSGLSFAASYGRTSCPLGPAAMLHPLTEYISDGCLIRITAAETSAYASVAEKKAMRAVRAELASYAEARTKAAIDRLLRGVSAGSRESIAVQLDETARKVLSRNLRSVRIKERKETRTQDGKFNVSITLEISGAELVEDMTEAIRKYGGTAPCADADKFRQAFYEELKRK